MVRAVRVAHDVGPQGGNKGGEGVVVGYIIRWLEWQRAVKHDLGGMADVMWASW